MNGQALEARLLGLRHGVGCPAGRVECDDATRPGTPGPPEQFEAVDRRGKPSGQRYQRGPALLTPPSTVRRCRCQDCGSQALRVAERA